MRLQLDSADRQLQPRRRPAAAARGPGPVRGDRSGPAPGVGAVARRRRRRRHVPRQARRSRATSTCRCYVAGRATAPSCKALLSRLAVALAGPSARCGWSRTTAADWSTGVHRVGGGDYVYGIDTTGETDLPTVITLRAGDPFFTYSRPTRQADRERRRRDAGCSRGGLVRMRVASSQAIGHDPAGEHRRRPRLPGVGGPRAGRDFDVALRDRARSFGGTGSFDRG